jgi:RecA/RadA recombinase
MAKKFYVFIGNFGSGKTELSLNLALESSKAGKTVLVDLDVINPYFRSSERKEMLKEFGIKLISPMFAMTNVDLPALPPDVQSVFIDEHETVVFDVGGDPSGATALGQYKRFFGAIPEGCLEVLYVVNPRRPLSETPEMVLELLERIKDRSRLNITGFINNSNLSYETSADDLAAGYEMMKVISPKTGIRVSYTSGKEDVLNEFIKTAKEKGFDEKFIGRPFPITTYMHRDWISFCEKGI